MQDAVRIKWEYSVLGIEPYNIDLLNQAGAHGWEVCAAYDHAGKETLLFKRQVIQEYQQ
jgi:hypothetical protein